MTIFFVKNNNQNIKCIIALLLLGILTFPSIFDLVHQCDSHKSTNCKENKSHLHQLKKGCEVCDFTLLTFNYKINELPDTEKKELLLTPDNFFFDTYFHSYILKYTQLRAPPMFS